MMGKGRMYNRRLLMLLLMLILVAILLPTTAFANEGVSQSETKQQDVKILFGGALHGNVDQNLGLAGVVAYKNAIKSQGVYTEIVDTGNAVSGSILSSVSKGNYVIEAMNLAGVRVSGLGVDEFAYGTDVLLNSIKKEANFQFLSCNFLYDSNQTPVFEPYKIVSYGGMKVAYIGISNPKMMIEAKEYFTEAERLAYTFCYGENGNVLYARVQETIDEVRKQGANYIVALGSFSMTENDEYTPKALLANTSGINAFINGNSQTAITGEQVTTKDGKKALITSAGDGLKKIGVLTLSGESTLSTQLIGSYNLRDIQTKNGIETLKKEYQADLSQIFATTSSRLEAVDSNGIRTIESGETNLGDLCADAYKSATGADVAFVEASEIRANLKLGSLSYNDILTALPNDQGISVVQISGYDLLDALEMSVRSYPNRNSGFLQVSGVGFDVQETIIPTVSLDGLGNFLGVEDEYRVTNVMINGEKINLMSNYTVAGTNALLNGETGYTMFCNGPLKKSNVTTGSQALSLYIEKNLEGTIGGAYSKSQGRIDSIKLARQSEINTEVDKLVEEKLKDYANELKSLRAQVEVQGDIIKIKSLTLKATSTFSKKGSKRTVRVAWTTNKTVAGIKYQVYKSSKKSSGYKKMITTTKKYYSNSTGLTKGKTYYYKVRGYKYLNNKYYYSDWSNITYKHISK